MSNFSAPQAADPTTPGSVLAQIAYERPDLRPLVAANPSAYPELLTWLAGFNEPEVNAALSERSNNQQPQAANNPAQPQGPAHQEAQQWNAPASANDQDEYAARGRGPEAAYAQQMQSYDQNQNQNQSQPVGYQGYGDQAQYSDDAPKRRSKGLLVGGIIATVAILGAGGWALANHFVFSKIKPAASPEEAVTKMINGVADKDKLSIYGALSPAEFDSVQNYMDSAEDMVKDTDMEKWADRYADIIDEIDISLSGLETRVEPIEDGLAKVFITDGKMTVDADADKMAKLTADLAEEMLGSDLFAGSMGMVPFDKDELVAEAKEELKSQLPLTVRASDLGANAFLMAVEEDGNWYVSPYLTLAEYISLESDGFKRGSLPDKAALKKFDTPEAAAGGMTDAIVGFSKDGKIDQLVNVLPLAERRVLALYGSDMPEIAEAQEVVTIPSQEFNVRSKKKNRAHLTFKDFRIESVDAYDPVKIAMRGACIDLTVGSTQDEFCVTDIPMIREFRLEDLSIVAVKEDSGWFVSPTETLVDGWNVFGKNALKLYKDGKLEDEAWLEKQVQELEAYAQQHPLLQEMLGSSGPDPYDLDPGYDDYDFGDGYGLEDDMNFDL